MQDDVDDLESPNFDWENNRLFDEPTRRLIDRIANDPRFGQWSDNVEIVEELAPEKSEDEQENLRRAAEEVFGLTVLPMLKARALQLVGEALANPDWDDLPTFTGESRADSDNSSWPCTDPDPRVRAQFTRLLARAREERAVRLMVSELPRRVRDLLVLAHRNADRESLLEPWIEGATQRRGGSWTAYYAQRIVREEDEDSVWDRYSAAAKILASQGWSKKAIADGIGIGVGRIDCLLERTSGQDIADDDPLCDLVPDLRGRGEVWRDASLVRARKPRPFSRLSVDEKVVLAEESTDPVLLDRLAKQGSGRISGALVGRYVRSGTVGEDILQTILSTSRWMAREMMEAHQHRPLRQDIVQDIVIALAEADARLLLDCDDATAQAARRLGRQDFEVVLAFRESDIDALERMLTAGLDYESFRQFVDLLMERLPTDERINSNSLLMAALQHAVEQTDDRDRRLKKLSLALVRHYGAGGDVGEDILQTILSTGRLAWWGAALRSTLNIAHRKRALPKGIVIALAEDDARVLLDCDDATAQAAKTLGRKDFEVVLAFRESDTDALERMLTAGLDPRPYRQLVDLLIARLPTDERINSNSLLMAVLKHPVENVRLMRRSLALIRLYAETGDAGAKSENGIDIDIEFSDGKKLSKKSSMVNLQTISDTFDLLFQKPGDSFVIASRGEQNYFEVAPEADGELTAEYREGDEDHHYRCVTNDRSAVERALWSWATGAGDLRDLLRWERLHFSD
ncbi:hypothetical protein MCEMIE22_02589 [Mycobacteriaceae bacterium]